MDASGGPRDSSHRLRRGDKRTYSIVGGERTAPLAERVLLVEEDMSAIGCMKGKTECRWGAMRMAEATAGLAGACEGGSVHSEWLYSTLPTVSME